MDFNEQFKHPPINTGEWFLTILITNIPVIGFIMLIVWAFDKQENPNKSNWAKAKLLWYIVGIGIAILVLMLVGFGAITGIFHNIPWDDF